jgi:hypothetical protein
VCTVAAAAAATPLVLVVVVVTSAATVVSSSLSSPSPVHINRTHSKYKMMSTVSETHSKRACESLR